jgi:alkylation response protein AidB-like acyl-CoA dehydrogenase
MATERTTSRPGGTGRFDAIAVARELGPTLAQRAAAHDADDTFVADSYADFKKRKLFSTGVPTELGGGGATFPELCAMVQEIGRCCGSSALALSMHTHALATRAERVDGGFRVSGRKICGGASFLRSTGIERIFRDIQGVRFHPWDERKQSVFSGRIALGLEPV